jgi:hypothetical protein
MPCYCIACAVRLRHHVELVAGCRYTKFPKFPCLRCFQPAFPSKVNCSLPYVAAMERQDGSAHRGGHPHRQLVPRVPVPDPPAGPRLNADQTRQPSAENEPLMRASSAADEAPPTRTTNSDESSRTEKGTTKPSRPSTGTRKSSERIEWVTPVAAIVLFLFGLGAAVGHCLFFNHPKEREVGNQTWTLRYSLALAFVSKSALAASVSIDLAQCAWLALRRSRRSTPVAAIDAMFLSGSSRANFLLIRLWRYAFGAGVMAAAIWLMPLTALVAPTSLTVGFSLVNATDGACEVPALNWGVLRNFSRPTVDRSLFVTNDGNAELVPLIESRRLAAAVLDTGR